MLVSEALSIAVNEFGQVVTGHQKFKAGQWVLLHLGDETRKVNEQPIIELKREMDRDSIQCQTTWSTKHNRNMALVSF